MALGKRLINTGAAAAVCNTESVQAFGADAAFSSNIALYQLDGNANDTTGDYNGTASNVTYATGQFGNAAVFNGSSSYIQASNAISNLESNFSISIWVNSDVNHFGGIINLGGKIILRTSNADLTVWQWNANKLIYDSTAPSANSAYYTYSNINPANTWTHITYVKTGTGNSDHKIYKNGVFQAQPSATNIASAGWTNLGTTIGLFGQSGSTKYNYFDGKIDQVRIFNREITAEEVSTLYNETTSTASNTNPLSDGSGVALYSLDYDASDAGGLYDGTPTNVDFGVDGQINYGARFNGSSSRIVTGVTPATGSGQFSVSGWVNVDSLSVISGVFSTITNSGTDRKGFSVHILTSGIVRVLVYDSAGSDVIESTDLITVGNWHHIAITYNNGLTKLYVDGNVQTDTVNQLITGYHDSINIGRYFASVTSNTMLGKIDQVRIFSKALNQTEIDTLFAEDACVHTSTTDIVNYPTGTTPVAYYKLDNSSEDYSTGGNDGTDTNIEYRFGRFGQAAVFDGSSTKITTSYDALFNDFSISFWVKINDLSYYQVLLGTTDAFASLEGLGIFYDSSSNTIGFDGNINGTRITSQLGSYQIIQNQWHHVVFTNNSSNDEKILYIDNVVQVNNTSIGYIDGQNYDLVFGSYNAFSNSRLNGSIDQVRIYDAALTSSQVTELYNEKPEVDTSNFKTVLYTGDGGTQYISNVGFQPDLIWFKNRDQTDTHRLHDSIRGITRYVSTSSTAGQVPISSGGPQSFDSNGFTTSSGGAYNATNEDYVAWCWKGGGDAVANQVGDLDSEVSANDKGFSIVKWNTGSPTDSTHTIGHGLTIDGVATTPEMIITKRLTSPSDWWVFIPQSISGVDPLTNRIKLNSSAAYASGSNFAALPTSTVFTAAPTSATNNNIIAYCFASVDGYSRIGGYDGSSSSQRIYVTDDGTSSGSGGFEPSWVMIKRTDSIAANWIIYDKPRGNGDIELYPDSSSNESNTSSVRGITFQSDGFTLDNSHSQYNASGGDFIYMAIK